MRLRQPVELAASETLQSGDHGRLQACTSVGLDVAKKLMWIVGVRDKARDSSACDTRDAHLTSTSTRLDAAKCDPCRRCSPGSA